jgi:hypothetical protein
MKSLVFGALVTLAAASWPVAAQGVQTLPPEIVAQMRKGNKLGREWKSPAYDTSTGFILGRITTQAEGYYANSVDYFPTALSRLVIPGSTNLLNLTVTDLRVKESFAAGSPTVSMAVEGQIVDRDGKLLFAFTTQDEAANRETPLMGCEAVMDQIAWSLAKDLGPAFQSAVARRTLVSGQGPSGSGLPTLPPRPKDQQLSIGERLIQLDNLRKSGLITAEEYEQKKQEIMKGL